MGALPATLLAVCPVAFTRCLQEHASNRDLLPEFTEANTNLGSRW
jgi:hypothetical protein